MLSVTVKSSFFPKQHMDALLAAMADSRRDVPRRAVKILRENTENAPPASPNGKVGAVDTGGLRDGWEITPNSTGAVIANASAATGPTDTGRAAGATMPPIDAIAGWVERQLPVDADRVNSVAFLIARAISARGLKPRFIVKRSLSEILTMSAAEADISLQRRYARLSVTARTVL